MAAFAGIVDFEAEDAGRSLVEHATATFPDRAYGEASIVSRGHVAIALRPLRASLDPPGFERVLEDERYVVAGDTRIDDREALTRALGGEGDIRGRGDDALVVAGLRRWGEELPSRLTGAFALAAWDGEARRLLLARDLLGERPLYYARRGSRVAFASSTTALRALLDAEARVHLPALVDYVVFGALEDPAATYFDGLSALPAGHLAVAMPSGLTIRRHSDWPVTVDVSRRSRGELIEQLDEVLKVAVRDRLRSTRVSVQLSGGLDSASLAAIAHEELAGRGGIMSGLTMSHEGLFADDEPTLARVAGSFVGFPVDVRTVAGRRLWEGMKDGVAARKELPGWGPLTTLWDEIHAAHATAGPVVLTGLGGDELFVAPRKPFDWWLRRGDGRGALGALIDCVREGVRPRFGLRSRGPRRRPPPVLPAWLDEDLVRQSGIRERLREELLDEETGAALPRPEARGLIVRARFDLMFELGHPTVTGVPLEYAMPLLDRRLVDTVLSMPPIPWFEGKYLLRRVMDDRLPPPVLDRRKTGLAVDPLSAMIDANLVEETGLDRGDLEGLLASNFREVDVSALGALERWAWTRAVEAALWLRAERERREQHENGAKAPV